VVRRAGDPGAPATVGAAAATSTVVGARGSADVEPDCQLLGILEQWDMDPGLTKRQLSQGSWLRINSGYSVERDRPLRGLNASDGDWSSSVTEQRLFSRSSKAIPKANDNLIHV
jgi:hypothetical protein